MKKILLSPVSNAHRRGRESRTILATKAKIYTFDGSSIEGVCVSELASAIEIMDESLIEKQNGNFANTVLAVRAFSVEIVSDNPSDGLLSKETVYENCLAEYLSSKAPNCNVDLQRIYTDDRCRYFQHYMPTDKTTAKHSYRENHRLHKSGNFVKLYISEVFA